MIFFRCFHPVLYDLHNNSVLGMLMWTVHRCWLCCSALYYVMLLELKTWKIVAVSTSFAILSELKSTRRSCVKGLGCYSTNDAEVKDSCCASGKCFHVLSLTLVITFDSVQSAQRAKASLNGADIYSGCCTLKIEYAKVWLHFTTRVVF